jgi:hypothetical protein
MGSGRVKAPGGLGTREEGEVRKRPRGQIPECRTSRAGRYQERDGIKHADKLV